MQRLIAALRGLFNRAERPDAACRLQHFVLQEGAFGGARVVFAAGWLRADGDRPPQLFLRCGERREPVACSELPPGPEGGEREFRFEAVLYVDEREQVAHLERAGGEPLAVTRFNAAPEGGGFDRLLPGRVDAMLRHLLWLLGIARRRVRPRDLLSPARLRYFYHKGLQELARLRREQELPQGGPAPLDRYLLHVRNHRIDGRLRQLLLGAVERLPSPPTFSIVMPVYNVEARWLTAAVQSLRDQIYPHWQLCIADDCSTREQTIECLRALAGDPRIRITWRPENGHICHASNSAAELATGEFLVLMDNDDALAPHALFELARLIARHPEADLIYSDEDKEDTEGRHYDPHFKPDFSPVLLLGYNYINHLTCVRRRLFEAAGRFRPGFEGAQDYDLLLRLTALTSRIHHLPQVLYHWRAIPESTAASAAVKPIVGRSAERALREQLERLGSPAAIYLPPFAQQYALPVYQLDGADEGPLVDILIPARNAHEVTARCVESLRRLTTYRCYRLILIDNGSDDPAALAWYREQAAAGARVLRIESPGGRFSFSHLMNEAASRCDGDLLLLLNNDTEIREPRWLSRLVTYAALPGVGAVGARLLYPNGLLQHAGVVLGLGKDRAPGHAFYRLPGAALSCFFQAETAREVSAVTGACLLTPRTLWEALGGFDTEHLPVSLNDVDYCLRLAERGLRSVYVAGAELIHHESLSRQREDEPEELAWFKARHGGALERYYNPHLSREGHYLPRPEGSLDYSDCLGRPLRVLFYSHNLNLEGAPRVVINVALGLKASGRFEPCFIAPGDGPARELLEEADIPVTVVPPVGTDNILVGWSAPADFEASVAVLERAMAEAGADLVVVNVLNSFFAVNIAHRLGLPSLWVIHESYDRPRMYRHLPGFALDACERAFEQANRVVFVSEETRRLYARYDRLRNATVIYNGLDPELLENAEAANRERAREALGVAAGSHVLVTVGTLCDRKDQETLVRACAELAGRRSDFACFIVGARRGTPYYDFVDRIIDRHGLRGRVVLVEETPFVERYYAAADLFVFTSLNESYSLTVLEAMAYGLPIITTPACGVAEQVRFGVNAVAVPFRYPLRLAEEIHALLEDGERRAAMGRASRAMLAYMPGIEEMLAGYRELCGSVWSEGWRAPERLVQESA